MEHAQTTADWCNVGLATIGSLPDLVLLEIFDFYVGQAPENSLEGVELWIPLVHVCSKWRDTVFGSPRRLNLHLLCTDTKRLWGLLDIWPPFPIIVSGFDSQTLDADAIVAALEHADRVHQIKLQDNSSSHSQRVFAAMQKPFPALTDLTLEFADRTPNVPNSFLGGSAPALRSLSLKYTPFPSPGLRKLLLSATNLVEVRLWRIPPSTYIPPEEIATCLSALTRLEEFRLGFEYYSSPRNQDGQLSPPPPTRYTPYTLPVLTLLTFNGAAYYLEDLISRIDVPVLEHLSIVVFHQLRFNTPQLAQFIGRTQMFKGLNAAFIFFDESGVVVSLPWLSGNGFGLGVMCSGSDWQLITLAQLCASSFLRAIVPTVEHLYIQESWTLQQPDSQDDIRNRQWLAILYPFIAVKRLFLSEEIARRVVPILQGLVGDRATRWLPALQSLHLEGLVPLGDVEQATKQFVAARQPGSILISPWIR